jgi:hypothetical protein
MAPPKRPFPRAQIALRLEPQLLAQIDAWADGVASNGDPRPSRDSIIAGALCQFFEARVGFAMGSAKPDNN